jgi:hypothetical protein
MLSACVAVWLVGSAESFTCTVNENVPAVVGIPVILPLAGFSTKPGGRAPEITLQANGAAPPCVATALAYVASTVPGASDVVLIESAGGGDIVIVNCWLTAAAPPLSVNVTVKVVDPEPQGLPEMPAVVPVVDVTN